MLSNLSGSGQFYSISGRKRREGGSDAQNEAIARLRVADVSRKAPHAANLAERSGEREELVFRKIRGKAVDVNVGRLLLLRGRVGSGRLGGLLDTSGLLALARRRKVRGFGVDGRKGDGLA